MGQELAHSPEVNSSTCIYRKVKIKQEVKNWIDFKYSTAHDAWKSSGALKEEVKELPGTRLCCEAASCTWWLWWFFHQGSLPLRYLGKYFNFFLCPSFLFYLLPSLPPPPWSRSGGGDASPSLTPRLSVHFRDRFTFALKHERTSWNEAFVA